MNTEVINRGAVARGATIGLLLFVPISAIGVVVAHNVHDFDHSGWAALLAVAVFVVYFVAGYVAARSAPDAPFSNGMIGAVGAFVLWIPIRIVIWAVRDTARGLVTGSAPVFTAAGILGQLVIAAGFGAVAGWLVLRRVGSGPVGGQDVR